MSSVSSRRGFSLTEVMIVTTLIGILAMLSQSAFQHLSARAQSAAYWNDVRVFAEAFNRHAQERGAYPADQTVARQVPAGMSGYFRSDNWTRTTPLGGTYEWDTKDAANSLGVTFNAAIKVVGSSWTMPRLLELDAAYDDGNLVTGNLLVTDAGTTVIFVIERATP